LSQLLLSRVLLAADCGGPFVSGQRLWISLVVGGISRTALVYEPTLATNSGLALALNFHGNPSYATTQADYTEMDTTAESNGFYVVYPQGLREAFNAGGCCAGST
jgi:poly(3-hydroxybutyrate) depolymerase